MFYAQEETDRCYRNMENHDVLLDPNHTHFILVDDGSVDMFGKEIEFRARLEDELRKGKLAEYYEKKRKERKKSINNVLSFDESDEDEFQNEYIPMILIVVQGGPNTLMTVEESLKENVPILVLAVS